MILFGVWVWVSCSRQFLTVSASECLGVVVSDVGSYAWHNRGCGENTRCKQRCVGGACGVVMHDDGDDGDDDDDDGADEDDGDDESSSDSKQYAQ